MSTETDILYNDALGLLKKLVSTPSFSKEEHETAIIISDFLRLKGIDPERLGNNVFAINKEWDPAKPTILLNSHHDTVRPNKGYTNDPFNPFEKDGKLYGLGSNDAGGCLVSLIVAFTQLWQLKSPKYNLVLAATAEEEISGKGGIEMLLNSEQFRSKTSSSFNNWCAIVGEPTKLEMAIAERGLMVLDCISNGVAGHAARNEGENALYNAMKDIEWFRNYEFSKVSDMLGPVKMSVTVIETDNKSHNIIPDQCRFVVDARINEQYSFEEVLDTVKKNTSCEATPRSTRLRSTLIPADHPLVKAGVKLGKKTFGSPTTSDKALIPFPALKIGPGDSARSHTANEFIFTSEIREGILFYIELLKQLL